MNSRTKSKARVKAQKSKSLTLAAAQKKTGEVTKGNIYKVLTEKHSGVRYDGKTKTFYYN